MQITKTKSYDSFSITELKEDLNIFSGDTTYDSQLLRFYKAAVDEAEAEIGDDIVPTVNTLTEESYICPFTYSCFDIGQVNITITGLTYWYGDTAYTGVTYYVEKYQNFTRIKFASSISGNRLVINYTSGLSTIPEAIKRAITIRVADFLDVERSSYNQNVTTTNKAFKRLLSPYKTLY